MSTRYVIIDFCDHDFGHVLDKAILCCKTSPSIMDMPHFKRQLVTSMLHEKWMWDKSLGRSETYDEGMLSEWFNNRIKISYSEKPPIKDSDNASRYIDRFTNSVHRF